MRIRIFWILVAFAAVASRAQNPFARYKVELYDSKNGMPNDFVMNTYQSKDGFIWMNGYFGYVRFDGKQFINFNSGNTPFFKTDNSNSLFTESKDSTMWFPTVGGGLVSYRKGRFAAYLQEYPSLFLMGKTQSGELILTFNELNRAEELIVFNPESKNHFKIRQDEYLKYRDHSINSNPAASDRWQIQGGRVYRKEDIETWRELGKMEGISPLVFYSSIFKDSKQRTWLTSTKGIFLWNGIKFDPFPDMENTVVTMGSPSFSYLAEDAEQGIWVSIGNGVAYLPNGSDRFHVFPRQYLNIQTLHNITIDREQNIWLATDRGVYKLSRAKVTNYAESEGILNNRVSSICEGAPGEFLISGFKDMLYRLKNGTIQPIKPKNPDQFKSIINIIHNTKDRQGNIWLSHQNGALKISPQGETNYAMPGQVRYGALANDGRMVFAVAYKGLFYINKQGEAIPLDLPKVDFSQLFFSSIHQLKDGSWLLTTYRTGALIINKNGQAQQLDLFNGTQGVQIFNAMEDELGVLWFATGRGLVKWSNGRAQTIGMESGLKDPVLFGILPDHLGQWWFPTNNGIFYAKYAQIEAYLEDNKKVIDWKNIDEGDGMNNRQCVGARHSIVAHDGKILVPGIGGLIEVDPASLPTNPAPPLQSINSLQVDDSLFYPETAADISPGDHRYIFDFSALSFVSPVKNQVRFRLIGRDRDWIEAKGERRAYYTNLAPGPYRFEVLASNNDGIWAREPARFSFTVRSFFYQTSWFKLILVCLGLVAVWLLVRWRTHAARLKQTWLENEVSQRTAELRNSLDQLQSAQKQLIQSEKMASLGELTAGIAHEIQNPLNFVNNFAEINKELLDEIEGERRKGPEFRSLGTGGERDERAEAEILRTIKENLEKISFHGKRADGIVKSMLQHSRSSEQSGKLKKEPTDINMLADEYLRLAYHGLRAKDQTFNATLKTDFDPAMGLIQVIPQDIARAILNLITNAFYAVHELNRIKKGKGELYSPTVAVTTKRLEKSVEIRVKDNGPGIAQEVMGKIFQPFFTTKPTGQGTGLGLSLAYDIVKAHGGEINVHSSEGEGSEFILQLPIIGT